MSKNDGRVISNFINQALNRKSLTIYGDGMQTRPFCYINDMIEALIKLMDSNYIYPINLGSEQESVVSIYGLLAMENINKKNLS